MKEKYVIRTCFKSTFNGWTNYAESKKDAMMYARRSDSPCFDVSIHNSNGEMIYHKKATKGWIE